MVFLQLLSLANLLKAQVFYVYEVLEVIVVFKHENFIFAIL